MRPPRHMHIRNVWEHSPTRKKIIEIATIKDRGAIRICVTAPIYLPGPTNPWALHMPTPLLCGAPHGGPRRPAWPFATCPRHLRLAWATRGPATWPQCRVASARLSRVPHQLVGATSSAGSVDKTTPFCDFNSSINSI